MGDYQTVTSIFNMTTDYKVTELFCVIDEFCKHFEAENAINCWKTTAWRSADGVPHLCQTVK